MTNTVEKRRGKIVNDQHTSAYVMELPSIPQRLAHELVEGEFLLR